MNKWFEKRIDCQYKNRLSMEAITHVRQDDI